MAKRTVWVEGPGGVGRYEDVEIGGGGGATPGSGSPVGTVTPSSIGELYVDVDTRTLYVATGVTSADWTAAGGGPHVGELVKLQNAGTPTSVPGSAWTEIDVSGWTFNRSQSWATINGDGKLEIDVSVGKLFWVLWFLAFDADGGGGAARIIDIETAQGADTDNMAVGVTPAIAAAIAGEEGAQVFAGNMINPNGGTDPIVMRPKAYQDSGGALNQGFSVIEISVVA